MKIEDQNLHKALVRDGDLLIARTNDTVLATEMVKIFVFVTKTGAPDDCEFLDEISAPEDSTLLQLKSQLLSLPKVNELNLTPSHLRLRERTKTLWFGKVFREDHKTIKKQNISFGYNLVVQVLPEPETLTQNGIFLYVCERKVNEKTRGELHEAYFDPQSTPNIDHLYEFALETLQKDWKTSDLTLAKYRNHLFDWEIIKDDRRPEERGTLMISKPNNNLKGIYNLKKAPVLLKEGDLIAVKHNLDDTNNIDDFSCEIDQYLKENYKKNKPGEGKKAPRKVKPERGIKIADF